MPEEQMLDILLYVASHIERHGQPPTQGEIAVGLSVSVRTVQRHLLEAEAAGLLRIRRHPSGRMVARGFTLLVSDSLSSESDTK